MTPLMAADDATSPPLFLRVPSPQVAPAGKVPVRRARSGGGRGGERAAELAGPLHGGQLPPTSFFRKIWGRSVPLSHVCVARHVCTGAVKVYKGSVMVCTGSVRMLSRRTSNHFYASFHGPLPSSGSKRRARGSLFSVCSLRRCLTTTPLAPTTRSAMRSFNCTGKRAPH